MKPRARRITVVAAVLVAALVAVLVVTHWGIVRDHVEAWHFQLTRETKTIDPESLANETRPGPGSWRITTRPMQQFMLETAAESVRCPVIFDARDMTRWGTVDVSLEEKHPLQLLAEMEGRPHTDADIRKFLEAGGYRVIVQRFPRRAYVLIRDADPMEQTVEILIEDGQRADPPPYGLHAEYPGTERP